MLGARVDTDWKIDADKEALPPTEKRYAGWVTKFSGGIASFLTIVCAIALAVDRHAPMRWLFVAWSVANSLWVFYGWRIRSGSLLTSQLVFCLIDVAGMYHYWIL